MVKLDSLEAHESLGFKLKEISEIADFLKNSRFAERPGVSRAAGKAHAALLELRSELEELATRQFPDTDSSRLLACYYPSRGPGDSEGGSKT